MFYIIIVGNSTGRHIYILSQLVCKDTLLYIDTYICTTSHKNELIREHENQHPNNNVKFYWVGQIEL